jgi:hypothetical protein
MGLPNSCKTTYIAALWHVVESKEIESLYSIDTLPNNREYLNGLRKAWLECRQVDRTKLDFPHEIELQISSKITGEVYPFIFPDVSGEMYEMQLEYRKVGNDYLQKLQNTNGILFFINPENLSKRILISQINTLLGANNDKEVIEFETNDRSTWTPGKAQTQIKLIELLQIIEKSVNYPCKIGVIISAWDVVKNSNDPDYAQLTPLEWVQRNIPLFWQYLDSNSENFTFDFFGVSAQGGNYKDSIEELQNKDNPSTRIFVEHNSQIKHDITIPIKWLLDEETVSK